MRIKIDRMKGVGLFCVALGVTTLVVGCLVLYGLCLIVSCVVGGGFCLGGILLFVYSLYKHRASDTTHSREYSSHTINQQALDEEWDVQMKRRVSSMKKNHAQWDLDASNMKKNHAQWDLEISDLKKGLSELKEYAALHATSDDKDHEQPASFGQSALSMGSHLKPPSL